LSSLPVDEQAALRAKVDELFALVQREGARLHALGDALGEALLGAVTTPSPRDAYIYVARELGQSSGGQPVIVGWSHLNDVPARVGALPQVMVRGTPPRATPPPVPAAAVFVSAPALALAGPRRGWWWLLWIALVVLLLAIAWLLLRACGLALPGYGVLHHIGQTFCPAPALAATASDEERMRTLADLAQQLELQIAQRQVVCLTEARRAPVEPLPAAAPPKPTPVALSDIEERLKREKAKTGELQISLAWDGPADLDLHVFCPNGEEIYYSRKASCGGTLDVDMNSEKKSLKPIENVYWPDGRAPAGKFRVVVTLYDRHGENRPTIPFQVRIKNSGDQRIVPGGIERPGAPVEVVEIVR
jgi:hypothetical protein